MAAGGFRGVLLPATAPMPYYRREYDPVWAAIQDSGMSVFVHPQTGGIKIEDPKALTLRVMMENAQQVNQPMTEKMAAKRMVTQAVMQPVVPQTLICELIGGGVPERRPPRPRGCPVSAETYAAGFGRFARIFIGMAPGYVHTGSAPTIEDVAEQWAAINDEPGYSIPADLPEWSATFMAHLHPS